MRTFTPEQASGIAVAALAASFAAIAVGLCTQHHQERMMRRLPTNFGGRRAMLPL
ncbi:MAG: hypothetical protein ACYDD1_05150 [Caulobacteraceae bacterium]